jgi:hypothetical protein
MVYIDFKIATWERVNIDDETFDIIKPLLENGVIKDSSELIDYCAKNNSEYRFDGVIMECDHQMTVEENGGNSTIEVYGDSSEVIWKNA